MQSDEDSELSSKLNQSANSVGEKMAILDLRDKSIRSRTQRQTNIKTAKAVLGTCPDMCPEYERYFRAETNQLSIFEMTDNKEPDEFAMVKEYRRSGADQEEPLPHELRPPLILQRTMDYLVCNIADRYEQNIGEWYDFVWSRLRAIRKDVTQQHLCDNTSVQLLEKCARFHIFCCHYLCEEDSVVFDRKINDGNLSQCLQSLKDFYYDLSLNGVYCENEPEFRCYEILLNLNESGLLGEVKRWRKELRESALIKFAINVYLAYTNNNFIKFFQLVDQATYLNACIIHRYFNEFRFVALKIFHKSYTKRTSNEQYPITELIRQFGFNDYKEVSSFCKAVGVNINGENIVLNRDNNVENITGIPCVRSYRLIEQKRDGLCVGEIINGAQLPPNPFKRFPVHSSFDELNRLRKEAIIAEDQRVKIQMLSEFGEIPDEVDCSPSTEDVCSEPVSYNSTAVLTKFTFQQQKPEYPTYFVDLVAEDLFNQILKSFLNDVYGGIILEMKSYCISRQLMESVVDDITRNVYKSVIYEEKKKAQLQLEADSAVVSENITKQLTDEVVNSFVFSTATQVYHTERQAYIETRSDLLLEIVIDDTIQSLLRCFGESCLQRAFQEREKLVNLMLIRRELRLAKKYVNIWREKCRRAQRYRYIRDSFPASNIEGKEIIISHIDRLQIKRQHAEAFEIDSATLLENFSKKTKSVETSPTSSISVKQFATRTQIQSSKSVSPFTNSLDEKLQQLNHLINEEKRNSSLFSDSLEVFQQSYEFVNSFNGKN
ncbi:SAC3 / GANP domain containing protein-like protein [Leptotrombidium deliense]|uniref:SAC3 / GANP domain containing protein-like protein n=1 Tax=Leptotrombidium deliense TaxID=299467 RepID=A0A443S658_9ACAR|nr:SAC3 / GANP domain containing protein-like protein [Leptotrombidium deliense]